MKRRIYSLAAAATAFVFCSCTTPWVTNTPRSAVEQYLLSATIERGVKCVDFGKFAGKKAFMDYDYFAPQVDKAYAQGVLEMQLSQAGIVITRKQEEADVIVQPLCGVLGTDYSKFFIGTPQLPIPVPNTDSFAEINSSAIYNNWIILLVPFSSHNMYMEDSSKAETKVDFFE